MWLVNWKWSVNVLFIMNLLEPNTREQFCENMKTQKKITISWIESRRKELELIRYHSFHLQFYTAKLFFARKINSQSTVYRTRYWIQLSKHDIYRFVKYIKIKKFKIFILSVYSLLDRWQIFSNNSYYIIYTIEQ